MCWRSPPRGVPSLLAGYQTASCLIENHLSAVENLLGQQLVGYPYNPGLIDLAGLPTPLVVRLDDGSWKVLP